MNGRYRIFVFLSLFIWLMGSFTVAPETGSAGKTGCIPPIATFAFPRDGTIDSGPTDVLPPAPWQQVSTVPLPFPKDELSYNYFIPQFTRIVDGATEIWVISWWGRKLDSSDPNANGHSIYVYNTVTRKWREVPSMIEEGPAEIFTLYTGSDGVIWAKASRDLIHGGWYMSGRDAKPYVFGKYNKAQNRFEPLNFSGKVPMGNGGYYRDQFWLFEDGGPIYSLDFKTLEIKQYLDPRTAWNTKYSYPYHIPKNYLNSDDSIAFLEDGSFYFLDENSYEYYFTGLLPLYHFDPKTNRLRAPEVKLKNGPPFYDIYVDRSGNLWMSDQGWMDKAGNWYELIPSPVFITTRMEATPIIWEHPYIMLQSSDGRLWYEATNGMVSLDPKKGEWCWFTTYSSRIIEDADRNLWMVVDGALYRNPLAK